MAFVGRPRMGCPTVSPGGTFDLGEAQWHVGVAFLAATQMEPLLFQLGNRKFEGNIRKVSK